MNHTPRMQPWAPTLTPHQTRRVGKTLEELGELSSVLGRITIQALYDIDPSSGKTNLQRMIEETADVIAQLNLNMVAFKMPVVDIALRVHKKEQQMIEWEAHF